jgi:hypothetical protein
MTNGVRASARSPAMCLEGINDISVNYCMTTAFALSLAAAKPLGGVPVAAP